MFDRLFQHPHALARHRDGPLAEERRRYLAHSAAQQMSTRTLRGIAIYTLIVAKTLRLADRPGECITANEIAVEADRWANRQPQPAKRRGLNHARRSFKGHAMRWLTFLGRLQQPALVQAPLRQSRRSIYRVPVAGTRIVAQNRRLLPAHDPRLSCRCRASRSAAPDTHRGRSG